MGEVIPFLGATRPASFTAKPELALAEARLADALREKLGSRGVDLPEDAFGKLVRGIAAELGYGR